MTAKLFKALPTLPACLFVLLLSSVSALCQSGPPPLPEDPYLDSYSFDSTNWLSDMGYPPMKWTNLVSVTVMGNALLLDTTNESPAFLAYNIIEPTTGYTNIAFNAGAVVCVFISDWGTDDTNQFGTGPEDLGYLLAAGDFSSNSPDGLWAIYFDPGGTNIYFGGVSNSTSNVFVSAPISWPSNSIHLIGLGYTSSNSMLYLDGRLAATGGPVTIVPATNVWTNGFLVGSDSAGFAQARGVFWDLELYDSNFFNAYDYASYFTNWWPFLSNLFAGWQGSGGGSDYAFGAGSLLWGGSSGGCGPGTAVYLTDMSYASVSNQGNVFTFTIVGGTAGARYDVFSTTNLTSPLSNSVWTWLGQGTNCGIYSVTNQPSTQSFYLLGALLDTNGSGLTVAYENLISTNSLGDSFGTPTAWYLWQGLNPQLTGIATNDPDGDGLLNYQEYLYGTNPQVSEGFSIWVSEPELTSGIP